MYRYVIASLVFVLPLAVQAKALLLNDVKAQNGVQLSVDELKALMPSAKVVSRTEAGHTRHWTNEPDGKFIASTDNLGPRGRRTAKAQGTWHVGDNGTYCVTLEWHFGASENWCDYMFKAGEKYYGVRTISNGATKAYEFEFSK